MAPITIKDITKISSESDTFPAANLLAGKKWMTCPKDKASKNVIEFSFQSPVQIRYIDIGYFNVASLEFYVGSSVWSPSKDYAQLIPAVTLQSASDAKAGNNKSGCKMLNFNEHMIKEVGEKKWDRVKLVLLQPYARCKQIGLEFVRFGTQQNRSTAKETLKQAETEVLSPTSLKTESPFFKMMNRIKSR
uniref:DNA repair protein XRCC1-like n=1 Tax=Phallusia mammillata TaxID=59560 RepID=A0A6F9DXA4_9ASCI|nr:DNA repair protein XRCC1-like [Phallusia mammillata]